ncbi:ABC transporter ATP-binding protein [Pukyongiella litopenaei]|uniref:ABC transporter ATP-binding protein n=1 Tax=Pukyongiella litopenaei TaxID=2605946 RepID=A0A2S0MN71_9RHOB|nr:ABC transporter ATP-binding protein [Pukyongiella litopenaei]AVO37324.2 ABC transporter ATP-binding protein [Pukyongiella litopenaei]
MSDSTNNVQLGPVAKRLVGLMARYRGLMLLSIFTGSAASVLSLSPYLATGFAVFALLQNPVSWTVILWCGLAGMLGVAGEKALFGFSTYLSHKVAFATQRDLRLELAEKLERVPLGFMDDHSKGEIRNTMVDEIELLEDGMAHLVPEVSAAIIAPILSLLLIAVIDWRLAILMVLPTLLGVLIMGRLMKNGEGPTRDYMDIQARMATVSTEMADSIATVRAFNQEAQAMGRARDVFAQMRVFSGNWVNFAVIPGTAAQVLLTSHLMFLGSVGLLMAAAGWVEVSIYAGCVAVAFGFGDLFGSIQGISHRLMRQHELLERIDHLRNARELPTQSEPAPIADASIALEDVSFFYGDREVLSGLTFEVSEGRCLALVGPSGGGKSTVARLIGRFQDVAAGTVRIGGQDVRDVAPQDLHRHIAHVFQDVFLFHGTLADNIRLGRPEASDADVEAAARAARAHDFISTLPEGYDTMLGEGGLGLSGGERQRISIARAVLKDAPILLLDEATAFADPENEALIQDAIAELARGRTVVVIAHRLHTIANVDEILVLDEGRIVERGTHADLVAADGPFASMWAAYEEARGFRHNASEDA